jgi:predicted nucleic acid-binding protein
MKTSLILVDRKISVMAGRINYENKKKIRNWGMADSVILATARKLSAKVLTGDPHFKNIKDAVMVG